MNAGVKNKQGLAAVKELVFDVLRLVLMYLHKAKVITTNAERKFTTQLCMFKFRDITNQTNLPTYLDFTSEYIDLSAMACNMLGQVRLIPDLRRRCDTRPRNLRSSRLDCWVNSSPC